MYDVIYKNMVAGRIAVQLPQPVFMDADGDIVINEEDILNFDICNNQPNRYLQHQKSCFFDETGCNTNQKKDGKFGGHNFGCGRGMSPEQICSTRNRHFLVLGRTNGFIRRSHTLCCNFCF
jgi:hypothetical protein